MDNQKAALDTWARGYRGRSGLALSDRITPDAFRAVLEMISCNGQPVV